MDPARVHLSSCPDYDSGRVRAALLEAFSEHAFLPPGSPPARVLVKPNLLRGVPPERAVTTHPAVLVEAVRILAQRGHSVTVGDSPGLGTARGNLGAMGCLRDLEALGARVVGLSGPRTVALPGGRDLPVSAEALEADLILNLPKWKTHVQVGLTGAVKNLFGCVPGPRKALQHVGYGHLEREFVRMLVGLSMHLAPALSVVDGVVAMEGDGPGSGRPRPCGLIVSGRDPVAVDRVLASLMGFGELGLFQVARELGAGCWDGERIVRTGATVPSVLNPPFLLPRVSPLTFHPVRRAFAKFRAGPTSFVLSEES